MTTWQKIRFWAALVVESAGWLFVVWAALIALRTFTEPAREINVVGLFFGLANGFVFLLIGALAMMSIRRCLTETTFLLLTIPAFATCAILLSFYIYAFTGL